MPLPIPKSKSLVTSRLVERVSERVARGIPLHLALAGEPVTRAEYEDKLRCHPELAAVEKAAKRKFLEEMINTLLAAEDPDSNIRWLLERLYPDIFGRHRETVTVNVAAIAGMTEDYARLFREDAKRL